MAAGLGSRWVPKELRTSFVSMMTATACQSRRSRDWRAMPAEGPLTSVVAFDHDARPARVRPDELGCALEHLGAEAMVIGRRFGLEHTSLWHGSTC
ncbi:MAG TPA: hypothetical protein VF070_18390 [Streptosporangiaceae bacterium]